MNTIVNYWLLTALCLGTSVFPAQAQSPTLDPSFIVTSAVRMNFGGVGVVWFQDVLRQPDGKLVVAGDFRSINGRPALRVARLLEATGARDPTFQPAFTTFDTRDVLVRPGGQLVFAGRPHLLGGQPCLVWGTLPDGALDPAFVPLPGPDPLSQAYGLTRDPATGHLYVMMTNAGTGLRNEPVRLLPTGVRDPSFSTAGVFLPVGGGVANSLAVQPNGRLLLGGDFPNPGGGFFGSCRLLPGGALDPSYDSRRGPYTTVSKVLVQPDGALLFAGIFQQVVGLPVAGLARMLDPNVLSARAPTSPADENALLAWPVPAREVLHLRLPAGRPARQAALLDALGRVVRQQALPAGQPVPVLPTAGLPPGGYLLRVTFASGPPAYRRVGVE